MDINQALAKCSGNTMLNPSYGGCEAWNECDETPVITECPICGEMTLRGDCEICKPYGVSGALANAGKDNGVGGEPL